MKYADIVRLVFSERDRIDKAIDDILRGAGDRPGLNLGQPAILITNNGDGTFHID